jgi:hypothetical protein
MRGCRQERRRPRTSVDSSTGCGRSNKENGKGDGSVPLSAVSVNLQAGKLLVRLLAIDRRKLQGTKVAGGGGAAAKGAVPDAWRFLLLVRS